MSRWQYQVSSKPPFQPTPPLFPVSIDASDIVFTRAFQYDVTVFPGTPIIPSFGYYQAFRDPVRRNPTPMLVGDQVSEVYVPGGFLPNFPVFTDFTEVTFTRSFQYQALAPRINFQAENITVDKWYQNFVPLPNLPFEVSDSSIDFIIQIPENITVDKWYENFSNPQKLFKPRLETGLHQYLALAPTVIETITVDKWFQNLSIPQKLAKTLLQSSAQDFVAFTELIPPVTQDWFYYAFSEPVRFKPQLNTALQLAQEALTFFPGIDTFQDLRWFTALSDPVRYRWYPASEQQGFIGLTIPIFPQIGYADVIVQTWNVLAETQTWVINLDLTGCDCDG